MQWVMSKRIWHELIIETIFRASFPCVSAAKSQRSLLFRSTFGFSVRFMSYPSRVLSNCAIWNAIIHASSIGCCIFSRPHRPIAVVVAVGRYHRRHVLRAQNYFNDIDGRRRARAL